MNLSIKICGLTRAQDVDAAVAAGADALGFNFHPPSSRSVSPELASALVERVPPLVMTVGLFVNAPETWIAEVLEAVPLSVLQFHGAECETECMRWQRPYIKAIAVREDLRVVDAVAQFPSARGVMLDAWHPELAGGTGRTFDWSQAEGVDPRRLVLAGGLDASNVGEAVRRLRPAAVDVASSVEEAPGVKCPQRMEKFVAAARSAFETLDRA